MAGYSSHWRKGNFGTYYIIYWIHNYMCVGRNIFLSLFYIYIYFYYFFFLFYFLFFFFYWRASEASEALSAVTQSKIGDICLYICLDVRKAFLYFDPRVFVIILWSTPSQTSLNRILRFIDQYPNQLEMELFTILNYFGGAVKMWKITGIPFLFELVTVVSQCVLCHGYKSYATVFTSKCIVH